MYKINLLLLLADFAKPFCHIENQRATEVATIFVINPLDARRRYTDFAQTSLRRQTAVYRLNGLLPHVPEDGIPAARCITDPRRKTVDNLCFLMHTGLSIPES